jgi:hypothetical protein
MERIEGLNYPFNEPRLVETLEALSSLYSASALDVPAWLIPMHDQHVNLRFGQLVQEGVDPVEARERAISNGQLVQSAVSTAVARNSARDLAGEQQARSAQASTSPAKEASSERPRSGSPSNVDPQTVLSRMTPIASHTPVAHRVANE